MNKIIRGPKESTIIAGFVDGAIVYDHAMKKVGELKGTATEHDAYFHAVNGVIARVDTNRHVLAKSCEVGKIVLNFAKEPDFIGHRTIGRVESVNVEEIVAGCTALLLGLLHEPG